jgi:gamma-glutamyltranspeptidase
MKLSDENLIFSHFNMFFVAQNGDAGVERLGFYTGPIGKQLVQDLSQLGGIITEEDMM